MKAAWKWLTGILLMACLPCVPAQGIHDEHPPLDEAAASGGPDGRSITVLQLDYREVPYALHHSGLTILPRHVPFDREPELDHSHVVRGGLQGPDAGEVLSFLWDQRGGRLYLDLNRNGDLTDDPTGVFSSGDRHSYQMFRDVALPVADAGIRTVLVDLGFHHFRSMAYCSVSVRSYWSGQIQGQDNPWEIGRVELPLHTKSRTRAHLFVRPWDERQARVSSATAAAGLLAWPDRLFLNGHAWQITHAAREEDGVCRMELRLTAETPSLGALRIEGQHIEQLTFQSADRPVLLRQPDAAVRIPVGRYPRPRVLLAAEGIQASRQEGRMAESGQIDILQNSTATLAVGGPLTNTVQVTRRGRSLVLHYQLLGAGGDSYQLLGQDRTQPPRFAVYQGTKQVASGAFEYG
jgi:hypothetical protein